VEFDEIAGRTDARISVLRDYRHFREERRVPRPATCLSLTSEDFLQTVVETGASRIDTLEREAFYTALNSGTIGMATGGPK